MAGVDVVVRGGTIVNAEGLREADVAIEAGRIVAIDEHMPAARQTIDATGLHVMPGLLDVHVHFNEPGHTSWEGGATGSRALAAGGGTLFVDMPLNSVPCTIGVDDFDRKRAALEAVSITDFALWGGLVPGRVGDMAAMAERGVVGFKAFMCDSGLPEFPWADDDTLRAGLREASKLGLPIAVHAETQAMTRLGRPVDAEIDAIRRATQYAGEAGARLHLVHVSSGNGVRVAAEARARGVDVSIETCPHYLFFTEDDTRRLGSILKCAPPLRSADVQESLWRELLAGAIDIVGSDHSPSEPTMKAGDFAAAWGGIAGVQSTLAVLLDCGWSARRLALERVAALTSRTPARRFGIGGKGEIAEGADADLVLIDVNATTTLAATDLQQRHKLSPYMGSTFHGRIRRTIRRGDTIYEDGKIVAETRGRFVRPVALSS